jgi:hypothetical protein
MDGSLKPVLKRQAIFVGASLGAGLLLTYYFGFLVGLTANIAIFMAAIFFIRWRQQKALKSLGFGSQTAGRGYEAQGVKLKYVCLSCGAEVKGDRCSCGSRMRKPLF